MANRNARSPQSRGLSWQNKASLYALALVIFSAWYLTPISDYTAGVIVSLIPPAQDVEIGKQALRESRYRYSSRRDLIDRVRKAGYLLSRFIDQRYNWDFNLIKEDVINAFAYPGGYIFITEALMNTLKLTDEELAAVLAHEIGHVLNRHSQKQIVKEKVISFVLSMIFYEDNDSHKESFGETAGELLLKVAHQFGDLKFSRKNEYEADSTGWDILIKAGVDPRSMIMFFKKLMRLQGKEYKSAEQYKTTSKTVLDGLQQWESTHPATEERIKALEQKWIDLDHNVKVRFSRNRL